MLSRLRFTRSILSNFLFVNTIRTKRTGRGAAETASAIHNNENHTSDSPSFITCERTAELNVKQVEDSMGQILGSCRDELVKLRIGRAHLSILDGIRVKKSENEQTVPISSIGSAMIKDPSTIIVTLWDGHSKALVSAVNSANLNLTAIAESAERVRITVPK